MDDSISRQAAIDALCDNCDHVEAVCPHYPCKQYIAIENLPPAQPERKKETKMMDDCMEFPNTVEEYMEQYKIVDTEEVYTNGIELVPIFRMRQWFAHKEVMRMKHQLDYEDEKSKTLRHYSVITTAKVFQIDAEKIEKVYVPFNPEALRFIVDDEIIAEFYVKDVYGWFERRDPK